jgi:hypothetical protein
MPNDLDQVAAAAPKNVEITACGFALQTFLNQTRKARESAAHIRMAGRKPHPHITRYGNSSAFKYVEDPRQRFRVNVCIHTDASSVAKIDLDQSVPGGR